jgi:ubiquinone/menaquinone biosynthesis C-methylase UbiE
VNGSDKRFFYDAIADEFDVMMNRYDLDKRLRLVFDDFLGNLDLRGMIVLDAGCGTGWFSQRAVERGASVVSLDVGMSLLQRVAEKCDSRRVAGDLLSLPFPSGSFDVVVCSEVIEHTLDPRRAVVELGRVLRLGGLMALTVPNRLWHPAIVAATRLGLRPYEGYENWPGWRQVRRWLEDMGMEIVEQVGFHIVPYFSPRIYGLIDRLDSWHWLHPVMVNIGVLARKQQQA